VFESIVVLGGRNCVCLKVVLCKVDGTVCV
jgi:hypothetical protein